MRKVVDFVNIAVSVLFGAYLIVLVFFRPEKLMAAPEWLVTSGVVLITLLVGLFTVGANLYILFNEWKAGGLRRNLKITTDHGQNELSVAALEMLLLRDLKSQPDIVDPVITLYPRGEGKPMLCLLELKLRRQNDVIHRMDAIKLHIREIFDRLIPGGITVEVQEEVRGFVEDAPKTRESAVMDKEFNGPVYSDGGDADGI
ncbi:MAG: hypothetical protein LBJ46_04980 [Planctomycetota bacterium]|jgi:hypothetical protein|nr:hypothetical protein [Planctomycetota bacterium]